jgi:limonene-1,2-epoxide hydrolase
MDNDQLIRTFLDLFHDKDAATLAPYLHRDIVFQNYGDPELRGREAVLAMWSGVFANMERVEFSTLNQAVTNDVVIAEQIHGLALPGRPLAPIKNMAIYRINGGQIIEWRDYTNSEYARTLL